MCKIKMHKNGNTVYFFIEAQYCKILTSSRSYKRGFMAFLYAVMVLKLRTSVSANPVPALEYRTV